MFAAITTNFNRNGDTEKIWAEINHAKNDAHANSRKIEMSKSYNWHFVVREEIKNLKSNNKDFRGKFSALGFHDRQQDETIKEIKEMATDAANTQSFGTIVVPENSRMMD